MLCQTEPNGRHFHPWLLETHLALERHGPLVGKTWPWASPLPTGWSVGLAAPYRVLLDHFSHRSRLFQLSAMLCGGHGTWMKQRVERTIRPPRVTSPTLAITF